MSEYKKTALVLGAGGFIGSHMVRRLRSEGYWVVAPSHLEMLITLHCLSGNWSCIR